MKTLVIGLGNPILTDDSVGLQVVRRLKHLVADRPGVDVAEDYWGGLRLMEQMIGYDRAIVVDAIQSGADPGTICQLTVHSMPTQRSTSAHDVNLATALAFGRTAGADVPRDDQVILIGIEADDVTTFSEDCTEPVRLAIGRAVDQVVQVLNDPIQRPTRGGHAP